MSTEWHMPADMTPSEALEFCAMQAVDCIAVDGGLIMNRLDAAGFVGVLRSIARRARIVERIASAQAEPESTDKIIPFHRRSCVSHCGAGDGDAE
ncbi:MAG: hypothetical protein QOJ54_1419 [Aliidongia sp.]|jgi:hypothetical protein|nr:hypothetical protein [Aliidongia sp.]